MDFGSRTELCLVMKSFWLVFLCPCTGGQSMLKLHVGGLGVEILSFFHDCNIFRGILNDQGYYQCLCQFPE